MNDTPARKCPKCGARLTAERLDHQLSGQERLFCPLHGEVGILGKTRAHEYRNQLPDHDEFE
jgi:hypothetical protein